MQPGSLPLHLRALTQANICRQAGSAKQVSIWVEQLAHTHLSHELLARATHSCVKPPEPPLLVAPAPPVPTEPPNPKLPPTETPPPNPSRPPVGKPPPTDTPPPNPKLPAVGKLPPTETPPPNPKLPAAGK